MSLIPDVKQLKVPIANMMQTQTTESMMVYSFLKFKWWRSISFAIGFIILGISCGEADPPFISEDTTKIAISFQRANIKYFSENDSWEMTLLLTLTNRIADTFVMLPSDMSAFYCLEYDCGEPWIEGAGRRTLSTETLTMSDLSVPAFRLNPFRSQSFSFRQEFFSQPRIGTGRLTVSLLFYPTDNVVPPSIGHFFSGELRLDSRVEVACYGTNSMDFSIIPQNP